MEKNLGYRRLKPLKIINTVERQSRRLGKKFPESGLYQVSTELIALAKKANDESKSLNQPVKWVWIINSLLIILIILGLFGVASNVHIPTDKADFFEIIQIVEAGINDIVLIGAGIFFLLTLENRVKRAKAMTALHELRAIAHVIDMHQITKDPMLLTRQEAEILDVPQRVLTPTQLSRYLHYCTDLLSLTAKISALYIQHFEDAVVLASVNEIESLTNALSQKIWQKQVILNSLDGAKS